MLRQKRKLGPVPLRYRAGPVSRRYRAGQAPYRNGTGQAPYYGTGQAVSEYLVLIVLIIGAFILMQPYILRAFSGRWKGVGDSLGQGRLYDPNKTKECIYDFEFLNEWYSAKEFSDNHCDKPCYSSLINSEQRARDCRNCILSSRDADCD